MGIRPIKPKPLKCKKFSRELSPPCFPSQQASSLFLELLSKNCIVRLGSIGKVKVMMACPGSLEQEGPISNLTSLSKYPEKVMDCLVVKEKQRCAGTQTHAEQCFFKGLFLESVFGFSVAH